MKTNRILKQALEYKQWDAEISEARIKKNAEINCI
jgi:hypothetical protein